MNKLFSDMHKTNLTKKEPPSNCIKGARTYTFCRDYHYYQVLVVVVIVVCGIHFWGALDDQKLTTISTNLIHTIAATTPTGSKYDNRFLALYTLSFCCFKCPKFFNKTLIFSYFHQFWENFKILFIKNNAALKSCLFPKRLLGQRNCRKEDDSFQNIFIYFF